MAAGRVSLLDVNVLLALFFPDHIHHELVHDYNREHHTMLGLLGGLVALWLKS